MPSCREIFNETVVVTRIIHVLTQASLAFSLSRSSGIERKGFIQGLRHGIYKDLFRFWDGYFPDSTAESSTNISREFIPPEWIYPCFADRYDWSESSNSKISSLDPTCYARVIHFFLLGCTSRRVVDRAAPDSIIFYNWISIQTVDRTKIISHSLSIHLSIIQSRCSNRSTNE